jgi:hypothetical protein
MSDTYVLARYREVDPAAAGIQRLLGASVKPGDIDVMTGVPYPEEVWGLPESKSNIRKVAAIFWVIGACCGFTLAAGTAWLYPLPTGGKPIVSLPTAAVIVYEMSMLMGIFSVAAATLIESKLPNFKKLPYHPAVSDGHVVLSVRCTDESQATKVDEVLKASNADEVLRHV